MAELTTLLWVLAAILITTVLWLVYLTLAVNADSNREDFVIASPPIGDDPSTFLRALQGATGEKPSSGNHVDVLFNGDQIFPAMLDAIRESKETVHFATYVWWEGKTVPDTFADLFCETAKRGVTVRLVIDSEGAESMSRALLEKMQGAGCHVAFFRSMHWNTWMRYNQRSHRRLLIVDGKVGFTGGVGIADEWAGDAENSDQWRDTHARVRGPVVASLQAAFADNWNKATSELLLNAQDYPELLPVGDMEASMVVSAPTTGTSAAQRTMASLIAGSTKTLYVTNAYFVPTPAFVHNLRHAAKRGVDVQIIVPGPHHDMPVVRYASWHSWKRLLKAGVKIFEYQPTMIHCKTVVVDGQVSLVGSINFDPRSFALNLECGVVVADAVVATRMEAAFRSDLERSRQITIEEVRARNPFRKTRDAISYWVRGQL